ncbi:SAC3 domain-containing protein 1 isoform X2 [Bacillus rossius redtenbacheri]
MIFDHLEALTSNLRRYYPPIEEGKQWIKNPFDEDNLNNLNLTTSQENELIELSCDSMLKSVYKEKDVTFWMETRTEYPTISVTALRRERRGLLHVLEMRPGTERGRLPAADPSRTVKCFTRSAAGRERPPASLLRPPPVLHATLRYLLGNVVADTRYNWHLVYEFVFDRLRAIRQDMVVQGVCPTWSITLLQPMVRFHAYAGYRLCEEPAARFDAQINRTQLLECLKTLLGLYDELEHAGSCSCPECAGEAVTATGPSDPALTKARVQMEALYGALNLGSALAIGRNLQLGLHKRDPTLAIVLKMSLSHWLGHYVHVYRSLIHLPALVMCVAVLHLPSVRRNTLQVMSVAFGSRNLGYPISKLASLLLYSTDNEAANDCRRYSLAVKDGSVMFHKKVFTLDASPSPVQHEPFLEDKLNGCDLPEMLLGTGSH